MARPQAGPPGPRSHGAGAVVRGPGAVGAALPVPAVPGHRGTGSERCLWR